MRVTEKGAARHTKIGNGYAVSRDPSPIAESVDFGTFGAKEIRDVLKNKAHCLRAGFPPDHVIIATFDEIRDHYLLRVGMRTYLSQMLGELAIVPIRDCTLYAEDGHRILITLNGNHNQPVQRFIAKQFGIDTLPFRVEVCKGSNPDRIEMRYL
jgi:hypothetical protein